MSEAEFTSSKIISSASIDLWSNKIVVTVVEADVIRLTRMVKTRSSFDRETLGSHVTITSLSFHLNHFRIQTQIDDHIWVNRVQ